MDAESTEVVVQEPKKTDIMVGGPVTGGLVPRSMDELWRMASMFHASQMMPKSLNTREKVAVAIQLGLELGLSPMQAVQNIAVINNRPAIWGDAALGLVQASGLLEEFKETAIEDASGKCVGYRCHVKRRGMEPIDQKFDKADASQAQLLAKGGTWQTYPQRMYQMRARSWALRDSFADVLKGLRLAEEQQDVIETEYIVVEPPKLTAGRHDAKKKPQPPPEAAQEPQEAPEPPATTKAPEQPPETPEAPPKRKRGRPKKVTPEPEPTPEPESEPEQQAPEGAPSEPTKQEMIEEIQDAVDEDQIPFQTVKVICNEIGIDPFEFKEASEENIKTLHERTVGVMMADGE